MLIDTQTLLRRHLSQVLGLSALVLTMGAYSDESKGFDDQACFVVDRAAEYLTAEDASVRWASEEVFTTPFEYCAFDVVEPAKSIAVPSQGLPWSKAMTQAGRMALERVVLPSAKLRFSAAGASSAG